MDPRQAPAQRHHHPFQDKHDVPPWARTLNDNLQLIWWVLELNMEKLDMTKDEIVAALAANTQSLSDILTAADALNEGQVSIADEITALKDQIAAGQTPDLSDLEAAVNAQKSVIDQVRTAVGAPAEPAPAPEQ